MPVPAVVIIEGVPCAACRAVTLAAKLGRLYGLMAVTAWLVL